MKKKINERYETEKVYKCDYVEVCDICETQHNNVKENQKIRIYPSINLYLSEAYIFACKFQCIIDFFNANDKGKLIGKLKYGLEDIDKQELEFNISLSAAKWKELLNKE